jgi:hypothetical protein
LLAHERLGALLRPRPAIAGGRARGRVAILDLFVGRPEKLSRDATSGA